MLQDKLAVITGAARGIGRAIGVEITANGADVRHRDRGVRLASIERGTSHTGRARRDCPDVQELRPARRGHQGRHLRDIDALRHIADRIERDYGKIDIVVANAGALPTLAPASIKQPSKSKDKP
jgi:NAD(P)-dependent dehydrogenase (short-subunit alcohol dehydrogenase family)